MGKEKLKEIFVVGNKQFYGSAIRGKQKVFDIDGMLKQWKAWFNNYHYFLTEKKQSSKVREDGNELKIEWNAFRNIDDYVRFWIKIDAWFLRLNEVTVEIDGQKQKMQKGDFNIRFKGYFEKNYRGRWKNEFLRRVYDRFIIKARLIKMEGKIWYETNNLIQITKKFMYMINP